jgi:hypothetical protein
MSINGVGSTAATVSAAAAEPAPSAQATNTTLKTLYGSPGMVEGLANTLQRMQQLLQPAQVHVKAAHPELQ